MGSSSDSVLLFRYELRRHIVYDSGKAIRGGQRSALAVKVRAFYQPGSRGDPLINSVNSDHHRDRKPDCERQSSLLQILNNVQHHEKKHEIAELHRSLVEAVMQVAAPTQR